MSGVLSGAAPPLEGGRGGLTAVQVGGEKGESSSAGRTEVSATLSVGLVGGS